MFLTPLFKIPEMSKALNLNVQNQSFLVLASSSPRRKELLSQMGLRFTITPSHIDESLLPHENPKDGAKRLALAKAHNVAGKISPSSKPTFVLGADTLVVIGEQILGKPSSPNEATTFLKKLSGQTHRVITGYAIVQCPGTIICSDVNESLVTMKTLSDQEITRYVETGEPMDKAGAYAAQGLGARLIEKIEGLESNVIGLPMEILKPWFKKLGLYP